MTLEPVPDKHGFFYCLDLDPQEGCGEEGLCHGHDFRGLYACGCDPKVVNYRTNRRNCPRHYKPYVPMTPTKARKAPLLSSSQIIEILERKYVDPWASFSELRVRTGWGKGKWVTPCDTKGNPLINEKTQQPLKKRIWEDDVTLDFFAMHTWPSKGFKRIAFEVKVSRADYKNEVKKPWKREPGLNVSNEFYFVTPPGLLTKDEVFPECGLMEAFPDGSLKVIKRAPKRNEDAIPSWAFTASIARKASRTGS